MFPLRSYRTNEKSVCLSLFSVHIYLLYLLFYLLLLCVYVCVCLVYFPGFRYFLYFAFCFLHVSTIGFSDHVDLWVIKIKSLWSIARLVRRDHVSRARNADHAARTNEMFAYSIVKITRFYDYQTWLTHFFEKCTRCAKVCGLFFLDFAFRTLIGWADKLRSHG